MFSREEVRRAINTLIAHLGKWRRVNMALAIVVVFVTTYLLILPAFTLEKDKTEDLGGINLTGMTAEQSDESSDDESFDVQDGSQPSELPSDNTADSDAGQENEARSAEDGSDLIIIEDPDTTSDENESSPEQSDARQEDNEDSAQSDPEGEDISEPTDALLPEEGSNASVDSFASGNIEDPLASDNSGDPQASDDTASEDTDDDTTKDEDETSDPSLLEFEGEGYTVTVDDPQNILPSGTELSVTEITSDDDKYEKYCTDALTALQDDETIEVDSEAEPGFVRLYDIKLMHEGETIEPDDAVKVTITYDRNDESNNGDNALRVADEDNVYIVHFAEDKETGEEQAEVLDKDAATFQVRRKQLEEAEFKADSFSVYAIVDAPEPAHIDPQKASKVSELINAENGFYLSVKRGNNTQYFQNTLNGNSAFVVVNNIESGSTWFFEDAGNGSYYISTYVDGVRKYVKNTSGNLVGLVNEGDNTRTAFEISEADNQTFLIKVRGQNKWLQYSNGGGGIRLWTDANNAENSRISMTYADSIHIPDDPYGLDGKSYGIAYHNGEIFAAGMTADSINATRLAADKLTIKQDIFEHKGILLVDEGTDLVEWTFESAGEDYYYISATAEGQKKYLTIHGSSVTLEDSPDETYSRIRAIPGTGDNAGKYSFTVNNYRLNLKDSKVTEGFNAVTGSPDSSWLNLVEKTEREDTDFYTYTARKVSVSDQDKVKHGEEYVLYTRIWNDEDKRYEFYVVDHDGYLLPCSDIGDSIEWMGGSVNAALWKFTEYRNPDDTLSYYYELQNTQYGNYIAPQVSENQILSDSEIGINLNGRRDGQNHTTIIAWDDDQYSYSGLKTENGRVVPCTLSEAEDFYFAVIREPDPEEPLTTVKTVDNDHYGITMKMIDFNNRKVNNRDSVQNPFFGGDNNNAGLLSTDLTDGYPTTTSVTNNAGHSLSELYNNMSPVNHLFIESIYNESGYFEYDSTQNFAHLNDDGNFTVYDQLLAILSPPGSNGPTRTHGQFMPYDDIDPDKIIQEFTNQTDVNAQELPDTDPRKGEQLYQITNTEADYFFGMEMEASFTQTENGLDAWGHDIIFEFSGDDDFWFYVDDELVLDLGGVHSAMSGSINFRTGEVKSSRGDSTLYEIFRKNYQQRGMSQSEINEKLDEKFMLNEDGQYVFRHYTNHTMKMFYMERGAGASNLHMRFNLAAVEPGSFMLSKKLSGTDRPDNDLIEFPYQIYYYSKSDDGTTPHLLEEKNDDDEYNVTYKDTSSSVKFASSFTPAGGTQSYENVFFLRPGQSAQVKLPVDADGYYVTECGVNPDVYDIVKANSDEISGDPTANRVGETTRCDYTTSTKTLTERQKVDFDNHVSEGAMRTLSFTKKLYDSDGTTLLSYDQDSTPFSFRLYLGNESYDENNIPPANLYSYYVKDAQGNYCRWDVQSKSFVSLGIDNYADLAEYLSTAAAAVKDSIVFTTSMNGAISRIPADHTVEVRDLIVDTCYKVEERDYEIPRGYTLRLEDGYTRTDTEPDIKQGPDQPIYGEVAVNEDPEIEIRNQKGWGLTAKKVWTDKDFMESHDDIFFAIYVSDEHGHEHLVDNTVRVLKTNEDELYYFFDTLYVGNVRHNFDDFVVREVEVEGENYTIDPVTGVVSGYAHIKPIMEGHQLHIGGTPVGGRYQNNLRYTVAYQKGDSTLHNENVRIDTVTNSRPGIKIFKTEWDRETPLAGAKFTLKDQNGDDVAARTYTSRESDGLVTIAYVDAGTYTLSEIETPKGYISLDEPLTIIVHDNRHITTSDTEGEFTSVVQPHDHNDMSQITIRNRTVDLKAVKTDSSTDSVIPDVHFALYRQVTDSQGNKRKDYNPMPEYEDLVTNEEGVIPKLDLVHLNAGTYYLEEKEAPAGYDKIDDICFTIGNDGKVTVDSAEYASWLTHTTRNGKVSYVLTVENSKMKKVSFMKVDIASTDTPLSGARFDLYDADGDQPAETPRITGLVSGEDGMLAKDGAAVFYLPDGTYYLIETQPPAGYIRKTEPVVITINPDEDTEGKEFDTETALNGVSYDEGTNLSSSNKGLRYNAVTKLYTMKISDTSGVELPSAGGIGTTIFYILGSLLLLGCGISLIARKRINL